MNWNLTELVALVVGQILLYRISSRQALRTFWFLALFYLFLFSVVQGLQVFSRSFSIVFYEIPLLGLALFFVFGNGVNGFPQFPKISAKLPDFYLLSGLWVSLIWFGEFSRVEESASLSTSLTSGFLQSLFAAALFPVLAGIKERLALLNQPNEFRGLPVFLISAGILLLGFVFFLPFSK